MSGDLKWNKIFGAALATGLVILGVREVSSRVYAVQPPEKMGYAIEVAIEEEGAAAPELPPDWGTLLPIADLSAGERQFAKCASCHKLDANGIGPALNGIVGAPVASRPGFAYSDAMKAHAGSTPNWSYDALDEFLAAPAREVPGTKMSYAGLKKQEDRVALIAWLRSQGSTGYAIPAPDPARQAGAPAGAAGVTTAESGGASQAPTATGDAGGPAGQAPIDGAAGQPLIENSTVQTARPQQPPSGSTAPAKN